MLCNAWVGTFTNVDSRAVICDRNGCFERAAMDKLEDAFQNNNDVEWIKFPYKISDLHPDLNQEMLRDFTGERTGFVQVGPQKWFFPSGYKKNAELYYNFQPRPDDVWIVTFPRSGTTWTQELTWLLANDLDYKKASKVPLNARFPFLEFDSFVHPLVKEEFLQENSHSKENCEMIEQIAAPAWQFLAQTTDRRFIKTHLPFELLPPNLLEIGCKVIYVARNPKDVIVSFYHQNKFFRTQGYTGDFAKYWKCFKNGLQPWTPYWTHIQGGWERRHNENLLFMFYEDMNKVQNLKKVIREVAQFLDVVLTEQQTNVLAEHLQFDNFKNNPSVNSDILNDLGITKSDQGAFVRKGKSHQWQRHFIGQLNEEADKWIDENLKMTDLKFRD